MWTAESWRPASSLAHFSFKDGKRLDDSIWHVEVDDHRAPVNATLFDHRICPHNILEAVLINPRNATESVLGEDIILNVENQSGQKLSLPVKTSFTVWEIQNTIYDWWGLAPENQRILILDKKSEHGVMREIHRPLSHYGVEDGTILSVFTSVSGGGRPSAIDMRCLELEHYGYLFTKVAHSLIENRISPDEDVSPC